MKLLKAGRFSATESNNQNVMLPENCTIMYLQQIKGKEYLLQLKTDPSSPICYLTRTSCYHKYVRHRIMMKYTRKRIE